MMILEKRNLRVFRDMTPPLCVDLSVRGRLSQVELVCLEDMPGTGAVAKTDSGAIGTVPVK